MNLKPNKFHLGLFWIFLNVLLVFLVTVAAANSNIAAANKTVADFDGDGKSDIAVFRPPDGYWYIWKSSGGYSFNPWGKSSDKPLPGDYDGDGKTDLTVFRDGFNDRDTVNHWYILRSSDFAFMSKPFGLIEQQNTSYPVLPADYDGDGRTDIATVTKPYIINQGNPTATTTYFDILQSSTNSTVRKVLPAIFSSSIVPADFDGDGKADFATYNNGLWTIEQSSNGAIKMISFGLSDDKTVPADYDGDGKADIAVWRPSNGYWYWLSSRDGSFNSFQFGQFGDIPIQGDYDGDGKTDKALFRSEIGVWYIQQSKDGFRAVQFGLNGDIPL